MQTSRELGARLRHTRMRRGYNHRAVADLAGMSERAWVELEVGIRARWASLLLPDLLKVAAPSTRTPLCSSSACSGYYRPLR